MSAGRDGQNRPAQIVRTSLIKFRKKRRTGYHFLFIGSENHAFITLLR
jgi:hypothetical protein